MAVSVVVVPQPTPGSTSTPTPVVTQIPDVPVLPGVTFNGSPAEFIQFMRDLGAMQPAPMPHTPAPPLTTGQMFVRFLGEMFWGFWGLFRGIYNMAILVILLLLAGMAMGYLPGITVPSNISFGSAAPISAPAPVRTGPSLSDKLDALGTQVGELQGEVEGLKVQPAAAPVVEAAPPVPAPEPAKKGIQWPWKAKATAATP